MKFIYADSLDYVDPQFDFIEDRFAPGRRPYWDDRFAHEMMTPRPYDGLLVSKALVNEKYTASQSMRFMREGIRKFLRVDGPEHKDMMLLGDNGAFSYSQLEKPPHSVEDTIEFYDVCGFTHGCAMDHIIFEFDAQQEKGLEGGSDIARFRFDLTLQLASEFIAVHKRHKLQFEPIGVVQGWSPGSMREAAVQLARMGYRYIAIGGLVPLGMPSIRKAVAAVHDATRRFKRIQLHLLGFAKADDMRDFARFNVASFDSTSPLIRAFKDSTRNYWVRNPDNSLGYFTALRIPQALENPGLKRKVQMGEVKQEHLVSLEKHALSAVRSYTTQRTCSAGVVDALMEYAKVQVATPNMTAIELEKKTSRLAAQYAETLEARPWETCACAICRDVGIETLIFRGSNRNKRRGMHNMHVFHEHASQIVTDAAA